MLLDDATSNDRRSLRDLTDLLLSEGASVAELTAATADLFQLATDIAGLPSGASDTRLPSGVALSPAGAANCCRDSLRTAIFLRGVHDAIREARLSAPDRPCEVVYAGTGPFAALALPLMTRFAPTEVCFTLLDVHEESVRSVDALVRTLGFGDHVRFVACVDATAYRHDRPIDLVICEVMQRALESEPQVEILRNLSTQLSGSGAIIPTEVTIDLLVGPQECAHDAAAAEGAEIAGTVTTLTSAVADHTTARRMAMPPFRAGQRAMYSTTVRVWRDHVLRPFASGLTCPMFVPELVTWTEGEAIIFRYETGRSPGIRCQRGGSSMGWLSATRDQVRRRTPEDSQNVFRYSISARLSASGNSVPNS